MRRPITPEANAVELVTAAKMVDQIAESLAKRPLADTDVAYAKSCFERGVQACDAILKMSFGPRVAA